ncbi:MAG: 3-oxoacyl-ACP synthase [Urechidicola sp.]|nr:3-oxoacyl-ACP synthase [Urechidicola sp.]
MNKNCYIQSYCSITSNTVSLNGDELFKDDSEDVKSFLKAVYKSLEIKYPKFFKMDSLSKLAFLGAELLLTEESKSSNTALVFSNAASSLDTDRKHQESINDAENYFPSPAVFVYTLPNIGIGEISIRHQLKSENAFFIFEKYNAEFHHNYENCLIQLNKADSVLGGWVNVDENKCEAFLYLIADRGEIKHTIKNLIELYNNK